MADRSSIDDVDPEVMARYKEGLGTDVPDEQVLRSRSMLVDGHLTNAGVLLFAKHSTQFIPCGATSVEKRAVFEAAIQAGARQAYLIEGQNSISTKNTKN